MQDKECTGIILVGPPGCLSADTPITVRRGKRNSGRTYSIEKLYNLFHGGINRSRTWNKEIPTKILSLCDNTIQYHEIEDVIYSGTKPVFEVKIEGSNAFKTTEDHKFLTPDGYKPLKDLLEGDIVITREQALSQGRTKKQITRKYIHGLDFHPGAFVKKAKQKGITYEYKDVRYSRIVVEAKINKMSIQEFTEICSNDKEKAETLTFLSDTANIHHIDENPRNNSLSNLQVMSQKEHSALHGKENVKNFRTFSTKESKIESIKYIGEEKTYDICMKEPFHSFLVNNVVVHNSGKSAIAKAAGNEGGIPTISLDIGGMKGSLVGQSEKNLREGLKVISAVSGGKALFISTCNKEGNLPPELKRRFSMGTFFCDLPSNVEKEKIWDIYLKKYEITDSKLPEDSGWTGAEIKTCCDISWRLGISLQKASEYIVPVYISAKETIEALRSQASGRFISASEPGVYNKETSETKIKKSRKVNLN
jgi:hypothetical protein